MNLLQRASETMQSLRRVGMDTARLTDEEIIYIDSRVVEAAVGPLVARKIFPVFAIPNGGILKVRGYKRSNMSAARISLYGSDGGPKDRSQKAAFDITVPVIDKDFDIPWRELLASRGQGTPIDTQEAENAAIKVAEDIDKLLITGEYTGFRALGVEGLATATGRNTTAGGDWSANAFTYVNNALGELETDKHVNGPYGLVIKPSWWRQIAGAFVTNTATTIGEKVKSLVDYVFITDSLYSSAGGVDNALVVELSSLNFEVVIPEGEDVHMIPPTFDRHGNLQGTVRGIMAPRIKRPTSICEITSLT